MLRLLNYVGSDYKTKPITTVIGCMARPRSLLRLSVNDTPLSVAIQRTAHKSYGAKRQIGRSKRVANRLPPSRGTVEPACDHVQSRT